MSELNLIDDIIDRKIVHIVHVFLCEFLCFTNSSNKEENCQLTLIIINSTDKGLFAVFEAFSCCGRISVVVL